MTWNTHPVDEPGFDAAWRAFADEDAMLKAPRELEARVLAAVRASSRRKRPVQRAVVFAGLSLAATLVIAMAWLVHRRGDPVPQPLRAHAVDATLRLAPFESPVQPQQAALRTSPDTAGPGASGDARTYDTLPPMLVSLGAAPLHADEPLQLARLRLPREALQALGVVLLGPQAGSVVDIDVLVGEDGLARDIRQVRTVQEQ